MRIVADVHERESGVPRLLSDARVNVEIKSLPSGDDVVGDGAIVERKTVRGMHAAIIAGTFWPQIGKLRQAARLSYLLIEGNDLDNGPLTPQAIRGACLAVAELGAPAAEAALACVRGISTVLARALLAEFGSLAAVAAANESEWRRVHGIDARKAATLAATFRMPHPTSHSRSREWRDPPRRAT
jgi:DNA excision repair protein ERCC-4